jgi:hypothetical protein
LNIVASTSDNVLDTNVHVGRALFITPNNGVVIDNAIQVTNATGTDVFKLTGAGDLTLPSCSIIGPAYTCTSSVSEQPTLSIINTTNDGGGPFFSFYKSRSGGNVSNLDILGAYSYYGFANGAYQQSALMYIQVDGTVTGSNVPTDIIFTASSPAASDYEVFRFLGGVGQIRFSAAGSFSANGAVATSLGSVGPTGAHTTVQKWLTFQDNTGATLYVPAF